MDESGFHEAIGREVRARELARKVLGVSEDATGEELRRAWRKACLQTHPDRNPDDPDAAKRFATVNCAYRLLRYGAPCDALLEAAEKPQADGSRDKYNLDNMWGLFLWWRDKFF